MESNAETRSLILGSSMNSPSEAYIRAAVDGEVTIAAKAQSSTRNYALNRAAFKLGTIPGVTTDTAIGALMLSADANGYLKEHGAKATRKVLESGFRSGQTNIRPVQSLPRLVTRSSAARPPQPAVLSAIKEAADTSLPMRTAPDQEGKPSFHTWAADGPPVRSDEKRRHIYWRDALPVRIKVMNSGGGAVNWYRVQDAHGTLGWQARKPDGFIEVPYVGGADSFDREVIADDIYWPEGEKDVDTLIRIGLWAITFGGTGDGLPSGCAGCFPGRNVIVLADNDTGGRQHAEKKAALIAPVAASVRVVHFAELSEKGDVSDWIAMGHSADDLRQRAAATTIWLPPVVTTPNNAHQAGRRLLSHRASDIQPERLEWIWRGRIARGKVMLIGGPPGLGKSQVTANIAATVSISGGWPCNEGRAPEGDAIILSAEDGIADTIVPRLIAAGANRDRVHIVVAATKPDGTGRKTFSLKTDVDLLERLAAQIGTVRLIVIDPISAYMGGADGNGNVETREVLEPLAEMANRLGIAVVAVTHLNKGGAGGQTALNRFAGSIAFVAAARSAYLIIEDPEDEHRRLFLEAKNNLGPKSRGLAFRVEQRLVGDDILASNISWETDPVMASVDEALSASENRGANEGRTGKDDAADFLRAVLAGGAMPVLEIEQEARAAGLLGAESSISQNKAFRSARILLGVTPKRTGGTGAAGKWVWELPPAPKMPAPGLDALHLEGHLSGSRAS
ncbi:MAG: AAA family ATPase [Bradyrhizobium sp.]|uniref:AAA family ATPase n=1 Tax=Bradyrhizobium sp. TaxID=376 RepID=UPI00272181A0|nr:AAA family ATPase [Bradyrhizobium sp.]MDO8400584.1 AAA family ATPase [Bradyrhizobium sp.]